MNGKKAKALRNKAKELMCQFVKDKVLTEDLTEGKDCDTIIVSLPERMLLMKNFTRINALGTKRWFRRIVKKHPNINYKQIINTIYGEP